MDWLALNMAHLASSEGTMQQEGTQKERTRPAWHPLALLPSPRATGFSKLTQHGERPAGMCFAGLNMAHLASSEGSMQQGGTQKERAMVEGLPQRPQGINDTSAPPLPPPARNACPARNHVALQPESVDPWPWRSFPRNVSFRRSFS